MVAPVGWCGLCPLTPALSQREREKTIPSPYGYRAKSSSAIPLLMSRREKTAPDSPLTLEEREKTIPSPYGYRAKSASAIPLLMSRREKTAPDSPLSLGERVRVRGKILLH